MALTAQQQQALFYALSKGNQTDFINTTPELSQDDRNSYINNARYTPMWQQYLDWYKGNNATLNNNSATTMAGTNAAATAYNSAPSSTPGVKSVWNPGGDLQNPWLGKVIDGGLNGGSTYTPTPTTPLNQLTMPGANSFTPSAVPTPASPTNSTRRPVTMTGLTGIQAPGVSTKPMIQRTAVSQAQLNEAPTAPTAPTPVTPPLSTRIAYPQGQRTQGMLRGVWT
jgi:hypothetical protein